MGFKARNGSTVDKEVYLLDEGDGEVHVMIEDFYIVTFEGDGRVRLHMAIDSSETGIQTDDDASPVVFDVNGDTFESLRAEIASLKAKPKRPAKKGS